MNGIFRLVIIVSNDFPLSIFVCVFVCGCVVIYLFISLLGYPVSERHCDPNNKPTDRQSCAAPCPQDCKLSGWSDWSLCSKTCGTDSYKVKFKMVLRWPLYGGKKCPGNPDENGQFST